jgi:serine/threonine protein kinase/tetratricopeptide (TPR) repeat protein
MVKGAMNIPDTFAERFVVGNKLVERPNCLVFLATDKQLGDREVAVKVFVDKPGDDSELVERFDKEVAELRAVSHSVLVPIIQGGVDQGNFYLAMELIPDGSLYERLKAKNEGCSIEDALAVIEPIAEALAELHEHNTCHGHLDSRAVLYKGSKVRLAGYWPSIVEDLIRNQTSAGRLAIDPAYISPEQITSPEKVDHRADIYSLSVLLFELLTGKRPFKAGNPLQTAMIRVSDPVPSPKANGADISALVDAAIMKGLAKNPDERFQTVESLIDALHGGKSVGDEEEGAIGSEGRMSTETIAVSMSTEHIQDMLSKKPESPSQEPLDVEATVMSAARPDLSPPDSDDGKLDVASTVMGMAAVGKLHASFGVVGGRLSGRRFPLDKNNIIIGSDPGCDICVDEKGVPPRLAIIVRRGDDYFAGPLSQKALTINDEECQDSDEEQLSRGDVLRIGGNKFRFIAPGEVFTLHDDVADRVVDRPKSRASFYISVVAVLIITLCAAGGYSYYQARANKKAFIARKAKDTKKKRTKLIAKLLKEGDEYLKAGALIEPPGENARERFRSIRELDPEHAYSKRRLQEIEERMELVGKQERDRAQMGRRIAALAADGDRHMAAGNLVYPPGRNAKEVYQEILRLDPKNELAKAKIKEIDSVLGDLVDQVNVLLARAQVYFNLGQYLRPRGENAHEMLKAVLKIDPDNVAASEAILELAAHTVMDIDRSLKSWRLEAVSGFLDAAVALNVNRAFLKKREAQFKLMRISRRGTAIPMSLDDNYDYSESDKSGGFLDTSAIKRRIAALKFKSGRANWKDRAIVVDFSNN